MAEYRTLPLGLDLGAARVRVAVAERSRAGAVRLIAVVSRERSGDGEDAAIDALRDAVRELGGSDRRCTIALGSPAAEMRAVTMPKMSRLERLRAARFEARGFVGWDIDAEPTEVRVHALDRAAGRYAIGAVRRAALEGSLRIVRGAHLRAVAADHESFALRRVLPDGDAILDLGLHRCTLHAYDGAPHAWSIAVGGADVTDAIARDLEIDPAAAERRKRIVGSAGAGRAGTERLLARVTALLESARQRASITQLQLTGNGARLADLAAALERASHLAVRVPVAELLRSARYPDDVVRAAAPDWTLAASLATYGATR